MTLKLDPEAKRVVWNAIDKHLPHITARVRLEREGAPEPLADIFGGFDPALGEALRNGSRKG